MNDCRTDVFDTLTGKLLRSLEGICRSDALGTAIGGVGYSDPDMQIVVADVINGTLSNHTEAGQVGVLDSTGYIVLFSIPDSDTFPGYVTTD